MKSRYTDRLVLLLCCIMLVTRLPATAQPIQKISPSEWRSLKNDPELGYKDDKELVSPQQSNQQSRYEQAFMKFMHFMLSSTGTLIMWILVIALVIYIIYRLAVLQGGFIFSRSKKIVAQPTGVLPPEEDLEHTNWENLLKQAMGSSDTRLAVRYRYMWLLQLLQMSGQIQYRTDKTNYDYYTELNNAAYKQPFRQISRLYEYAWYGNFALSSAAYSDFLAHFDHLKNQLPK